MRLTEDPPGPSATQIQGAPKRTKSKTFPWKTAFNDSLQRIEHKIEKSPIYAIVRESIIVDGMVQVKGEGFVVIGNFVENCYVEKIKPQEESVEKIKENCEERLGGLRLLLDLIIRK